MRQIARTVPIATCASLIVIELIANAVSVASGDFSAFLVLPASGLLAFAAGRNMPKIEVVPAVFMLLAGAYLLVLANLHYVKLLQVIWFNSRSFDEFWTLAAWYQV